MLPHEDKRGMKWIVGCDCPQAATPSFAPLRIAVNPGGEGHDNSVCSPHRDSRRHGASGCNTAMLA